MGRKFTDTTVTVRLDRDEVASLRDYGQTISLSVSALLRQALNEYMKRRGLPTLVEIRGGPGRPRKRA